MKFRVVARHLLTVLLFICSCGKDGKEQGPLQCSDDEWLVQPRLEYECVPRTISPEELPFCLANVPGLWQVNCDESNFSQCDSAIFAIGVLDQDTSNIVPICRYSGGNVDSDTFYVIYTYDKDADTSIHVSDDKWALAFNKHIRIFSEGCFVYNYDIKPGERGENQCPICIGGEEFIWLENDCRRIVVESTYHYKDSYGREKVDEKYYIYEKVE